MEGTLQKLTSIISRWGLADTTVVQWPSEALYEERSSQKTTLRSTPNALPTVQRPSNICGHANTRDRDPIRLRDSAALLLQEKAVPATSWSEGTAYHWQHLGYPRWARMVDLCEVES